MSVVKISTDNRVEIFSCDMDSALEEVFGSDCEFVYPEYLDRRFVMVVDGLGYQKGLSPNLIGCYFYGTIYNNAPILGDILILRNRSSYSGNNIGELSIEEAVEVHSLASSIMSLRSAFSNFIEGV